MAARTNAPYKSGELEVILSLSPTATNIHWLSVLLERSEEAIAIVYKIAFEQGVFKDAVGIQQRKVLAAKKRLNMPIGRQRG